MAGGLIINLGNCDSLESVVKILYHMVGNRLMKLCHKELQVIAKCKE